MSDPLEESIQITFHIIVASVLVGIVLIGIFALPVLAVAAVPLVIVFIGYIKWRDNPSRHENAESRLLLELYERTRRGTLAAFSEDEIIYQLSRHLPGNTPPSVSEHLLHIGRSFIDQIDITTDVPRPPTVANSVEGGRYKDKLARIGTHSPEYVRDALDATAQILGYVARFSNGRGGSSLVPVKYFVPDMGEAVRVVISGVFNNEAFKNVQLILDENLEEQKGVMPDEYKGDDHAEVYLAGTPLRYLFDFDVPFAIPTNLRTAHHFIVAPSGSGKTTLFESMIADDLKHDVAIIVIDSHREFLQKIAERVDPERVIWFDPEFVAPALNLFARGENDETAVGSALAMFDYIFASKGVEFTNYQDRLYRNFSRLCMAIPGASLETMREMCKPMATATLEYQKYIDTLDKNARSFFEEYHQKGHGKYDGTRAEVLGRLQTALDSETFARMLGAKEMKFDILKQIEAGKVILINTDKKRLQKGASLLGRVFLGLVMQAVECRKPDTGKQVYLYVDEFGQDYAHDSDLLISMFTGLRKYRLGMVVVTQHLGLITPKLYAAISASTAIRMASDVSELDENAVARMLRTTVAALHALPKYSFMAYFRGIGTMPWRVKPGRLDALPRNPPHVMDALRARMLTEYGDKPDPAAPPPEKPPETPGTEEYDV